MMSSRMKSGPSQFDVHLRMRLSEMDDNTITGQVWENKGGILYTKRLGCCKNNLKLNFF